ncbi:MAG TPA: 30S ribosomal protein S3 [Candidatus Omnitrophica bacterium]|nr:30S ribosomal protein S3 [Candidatus Omnitrophota bacterium]
MGQKVSPKGLRLGGIIDWESKWYGGRNYAQILQEDMKIRNFIKDNLKFAGIPKIEIRRLGEQIIIDIYAARPGVVIGRGGSEVDRLRDRIQEIVDNKEVVINIQEVKEPLLNAQLVAENVALQLEKRIPFRRAMKRAINQVMEAGAKGAKIRCKGRLGGHEIARAEEYKVGKVPLHTLRADIDYGFTEAKTLYGTIGVKVWLYKGDVLKERTEPAPALASESDKDKEEKT